MKAILVLMLGFFVKTLHAGSFPDPRAYVEDAFIEETKKKAISGDHTSSYWLSMYYLDGLSNGPEGEFWLRLSAEQNYCVGMKEYIRFVESQYGEKRNIDVWKDRIITCRDSNLVDIRK